LQGSACNLLNRVIELAKKTRFRRFAAFAVPRAILFDLGRCVLEKFEMHLPAGAMQMSAKLRPRNGLHPAGAIFSHPSLNLGCPGLLDALIGRLFDTLEQLARELGTIFDRQLRCLFVKLFDRACHERILLAHHRNAARPVSKGYGFTGSPFHHSFVGGRFSMAK
jgi:hypothetical protein